MIGQTLAHYKILEKIGSGGMGDVYLAQDTKLDRKVALKVLPPDLAENEERRARFQREAKAIAALNHPNIVTVYSVEQAEGVHFITMELVRGKTLSELLPKNGFPLSKFFEIAIPLTDAVAAAHQEGITHRDLKPDNMMVSDDGRVKVLDFGLAKPTGGFVGGDADSALPTAAKTAEGVIVGTVNYMSPEQAEGKSVDHRADLFSIGIILYEMATGQRPFRGDTTASLLSSIIKDTPTSVNEVNPDTPRELGKIIRRCLAKDPERRFQNAKDLRNDLEELKSEWSSGELQEASASPKRSGVKSWLIGSVTAVLAILATASILTYIRRQPVDTVRQLTNPVQLTAAVGVENYPTWSTDGDRLAYESNQSGNWDIHVTQLGGGASVNLTDHEGDDRFPSWSPDGRQIAFLSQRDGAWGVYVMSALGGNPRKLMVLPHTTQRKGAPQWSSDGSELALAVRDNGRNFADIVSLQTQETRRIPLPRREGNLDLDLSWSPDARTFAYVDAGTPTAGVTQLWVVALNGAEPSAVTDGTMNDWSPSWSSDGRNLFFVSNRGGAMDLWQQRIDRNGQPRDEPRPVTAGIGIRSAVFSRDGTTLAYSRGREVRNAWRIPILDGRPATWADAEQLTFDYAFVEHVDISPDGTRLAISSDRGGNQDLWILAIDSGALRQITTDPIYQVGPQWSPDGKQLTFYAYGRGVREVHVMPAEGGPIRTLASHPAEDIVPTWSPDGSEIAFASRRAGNREIWIVAAEGGEPRQLTMDDGITPEWSPDGQWIVFSSDRGDGTNRFWRIPRTGGDAELFSEGPGFRGRFSHDGNMFYFTRFANLWAKSLHDDLEYPITDFKGRRGALGWDLATDGEYLYFTWGEDLGDIWVMDVVTDEDS